MSYDPRFNVWSIVNCFDLIPRIYIGRHPYRVGVGWLHKAFEFALIRQLTPSDSFLGRDPADFWPKPSSRARKAMR